MKKVIFVILMIMSISINSTVYARNKYVYIEQYKYIGTFRITHYCPCSRCCGVGGGKVTASGTKPKAGRTVGVNPRLISYGTRLKIGNYNGYVAEDTGGGIGWYHIDVFCNSHQEAIQKGVQTKKVWSITYKKVKIKENKYKAYRIKIKKRDYL